MSTPNLQLQNDPTLDLDRDGLTDVEELAMGSSPLSADSDRDGLTDQKELQNGTDPLSSDSDRDGMPDGVEVSQDTNPLSADTDGDGLTDSQELKIGTDPLQTDTDRDGVPDGVEVSQGNDPLATDDQYSSIDGISEVATTVVAATAVQEVASYSPTRGELMAWYAAAKSQDQSPEQLDTIKELGMAQIQGTEQEAKPPGERDPNFSQPSFTLSPQDFESMKSTMATFAQQLQQSSEEAPEQTSGDRER
jgi:Bacterial TSP3 repeat